MTASPKPVIEYERKPPTRLQWVRDDIAYLLPMAVFMLFTFLGTSDTVNRYVPAAYPISYVIKTVAVATLLVVLWRHFTPIRWNGWWLGVIVGVLGIFQWV